MEVLDEGIGVHKESVPFLWSNTTHHWTSDKQKNIMGASALTETKKVAYLAFATRTFHRLV